ncbi:MAG: hypothetical protein PHR83_04855 [Paludibacter sp.]|nr:hypothetical protein [Paludibacter sp.]
MNRLLLTIFGLSLFTATSFGRQTIDLTAQTVKIEPQQETKLYYGFAAGDKISFTLEVADKNYLSEVEVLEYPTNSKYSDINVTKLNLKTIVVPKEGVYVFRLKNLSPTGRVCKFKIQRTPASDLTAGFNSNVTWQQQQLTTYKTYTKDVVVGYDTLYTQKTRKELLRTELSEDIVIDKTERVNSKSIIGSKNLKAIEVTLPQNEITDEQSKKVVAWAYWIGVGKEATEAWKKNVNIFRNIASGAATILGGGPLAGYAIGTVAGFVMPTMGEDVAYWFIPDSKNSDLFLNDKPFTHFDKGKGIAAFGKNTTKTQGTFYIGLLNDNTFQGIDTNVKISVLWETKYFEDKTYTEKTITPRYERKTFTAPEISTTTVPVTGE